MNVRSSIASTVSLLVGCGAAAFAHVDTAAADDSILQPGALIISSSNYEGSTGAVASLQVGVTPLANTNTATVPAISDNNYVTVWNNDTVDASFGVTSPIYLTAVEPHSGRVLNRERVPTNQVVTSFSSKSELALHLRNDDRGSHLRRIAAHVRHRHGLRAAPSFGRQHRRRSPGQSSPDAFHHTGHLSGF